MLATLCGAVASDEGRHEIAYSRIVSKLFEMCAFLRRLHTMPAELCRIGYHCIHTVCTSHRMTFEHMSWSCMRCLGPSVLCAVAILGSPVGGSHYEHRTQQSLLGCQRHCTEVASASCFAQGAQRHRAGGRGDDEAVNRDAGYLILNFLLLPAARDEDQLALFQELLGRLPRRVSGAGRRARRYFSRSGDLRHIKRLRFWPLHDVLREKYELPDEEVGAPAVTCGARALR